MGYARSAVHDPSARYAGTPPHFVGRKATCPTRYL